MKKKKRKPDIAAGRLAIGMGVFGLAVAIFPAKLDMGQRCSGAATACMAFSWGSKEIAAARKWKQESENEHYATSVEDQLEDERIERMTKSGSMQNVFVLLGWLLLFVAVVSIIYCGYLFLFSRKH